MPKGARLLLLMCVLQLAACSQTFFTDFVLPLPVLAGSEAALRSSLLAFLAELSPAYNASHITITEGS